MYVWSYIKFNFTVQKLLRLFLLLSPQASDFIQTLKHRKNIHRTDDMLEMYFFHQKWCKEA